MPDTCNLTPKFFFPWRLRCGTFFACDGGSSSYSDEKNITSFADLEGKRIGVKAGSTHSILLPQKVKNPQIKEHSLQADLFLALENGSVDAVSIDLPHALVFLKKFRRYTILEERLGQDQYGIALQRDSPFKIMIDSVLSVLDNEGFLKELSESWLEADVDEAPSAPEQNWPGKNGTWVVATSGSSPPFDYYKDNKLAGYSIVLIMEIAKRLDRKLDFKTMDFASFIPALLSQKVDMCISDISITEERQKLVNFSQPIYDNESVV